MDERVMIARPRINGTFTPNESVDVAGRFDSTVSLLNR
jgi:hypothetical protein